MAQALLLSCYQQESFKSVEALLTPLKETTGKEIFKDILIFFFFMFRGATPPSENWTSGNFPFPSHLAYQQLWKGHWIYTKNVNALKSLKIIM